jgi:hypothetical protein
MSFSCPWVLKGETLLAIQELTRLGSLSWTLVNWCRNLSSYHRDTSAPGTEDNPSSSVNQDGGGGHKNVDTLIRSLFYVEDIDQSVSLRSSFRQ